MVLEHDAAVTAVTAPSLLTALPDTVVVADASKASAIHLHRFAALDEIDLLITDTGLDAEVAETLRASGPKVVAV